MSSIVKSIVLGLLVIAISFSGYIEEGRIIPLKSKPQPVETIKAFVNYYNNRSVDELYSLFSSRVRAEHPKIELESQMEVARTFGVKIIEWEVIEEKITDKTAILKVRLVSYMAGYINESIEEFPMVLEDNKWVIDKWMWKTRYMKS